MLVWSVFHSRRHVKPELKEGFSTIILKGLLLAKMSQLSIRWPNAFSGFCTTAKVCLSFRGLGNLQIKYETVGITGLNYVHVTFILF